MTQFQRTPSQLKSHATFYWPDELLKKEADASIIPKLLETQEGTPSSEAAITRVEALRQLLAMGLAVPVALGLESLPIRSNADDDGGVTGRWKNWDGRIIDVPADAAAELEATAKKIAVKVVHPNRTFGMKSDELRRFQTGIAEKLLNPKFDYSPGVPERTISTDIKVACDEFFAKNKIERSSLLGEYLLKQALIDWCRMYLLFDNAVADGRFNPGIPHDKGFQSILDLPKRGTVCGGYSMGAVELAANLGFGDSFFKIEGHLKGGPAVAIPTHSWDAFKIGDSWMFSDPQQSALSLTTARNRKSNIANIMSCPLEPWEVAVFLASHFASARVQAIKPPLSSLKTWDCRVVNYKRDLFTDQDLNTFRNMSFDAINPIFDHFTADKNTTGYDSQKPVHH